MILPALPAHCSGKQHCLCRGVMSSIHYHRAIFFRERHFHTLSSSSAVLPSPLSGPVVSPSILHVARVSSDHHRRAITLHASVNASFLSHFRLWLRSGTHLLSLATLRGCHWPHHFLCAPDDTSFHDLSPLSCACPPSIIVPLVNGTSELQALKAPYSLRCLAVY